MGWMTAALLAVQLVSLEGLRRRLERMERAIGRTKKVPPPERGEEPGAEERAMLEGFDNLMGYTEKTARGGSR